VPRPQSCCDDATGAACTGPNVDRDSRFSSRDELSPISGPKSPTGNVGETLYDVEPARVGHPSSALKLEATRPTTRP
jgi:hypothetical protein